jgi:putative transposase
LIEKDNDKLTIKEQCQTLKIHRSRYYYEPRTKREDRDVADLQSILDVLGRLPFYGYRKISLELLPSNPAMTRKRVRRLMKRFGLRAIFAKRNLSKARIGHKIYPYLLAGKQIRYPNQVWASDITYIKVNGSFIYLVVILDLFSRKVLSWRISNTLSSDFCIQALEEALDVYGVPAIFNTDQGSQFTSDAFIKILEDNNIRISMDGKGRALDNIYVERLWRSLKYEDIYIKSYDSVTDLKEGLSKYFYFYNSERFHQSLGYATPDQMHESFSCNGFELKVA